MLQREKFYSADRTRKMMSRIFLPDKKAAPLVDWAAIEARPHTFIHSFVQTNKYSNFFQVGSCVVCAYAHSYLIAM